MTEKELDKKIERMAIDLNKTTACHFLKSDGEMGKEYMIENRMLSNCLACGDKKHCWDEKSLADLFFQEKRNLLNQDY